MGALKANATHVLLGEDDDEDYLIFSLAIEELSLTIVLTRAENGEILMKLLDEKNPDILFLDMLMPCKTGQECLREIRPIKSMIPCRSSSIHP